MKLREGLPSLRKKETFRCLRHAVRKARARGLAVTHFAILSNHIHLILEPKSPTIGHVFQSFGISFAKRLNALMNRSGAVFRERYHVHVLRAPIEVRNALAYVLTNESRHRRKRNGALMGRHLVRIDPFSSAFAFREWRKLEGRVDFEFSAWSEDDIEAWYAEFLETPRTWLLKADWKHARPT